MQTCKYCGARITRGVSCGKCNEKLRLIRQIRSMLAPLKRRQEREKKK